MSLQKPLSSLQVASLDRSCLWLQDIRQNRLDNEEEIKVNTQFQLNA